MKLQLALDDLSLEQAIALAERVRDYIDIIEAGTPLIYGYGMEAVRALKARFPEKQVLADMKIMDSGAWETEEAMAAGAEAFVTGEISYHAGLSAVDDGVCVLEAGHAATERPGILALSAALQKAADAVQYKIRVMNSEVRLFL